MEKVFHNMSKSPMWVSLQTEVIVILIPLMVLAKKNSGSGWQFEYDGKIIRITYFE